MVLPEQPVKACIFDLDGLLIDSEAAYTEAGKAVCARFNKIFDWNIKTQMMGRPAKEATSIMVSSLQLPISVEETMRLLEAEQSDLFRKVQPLPGALRLLQHLKKHNVPMAIATGSRSSTMRIKVDHLPELMACFSNPDAIVTADDRDLKSGRGKPEPDVFLIAARRIGAAPADCLVFEDGLPGIEAARRAMMRSIWVPDEDLRRHRRETEPDVEEESLGQSEVLATLEQFVPERYGLPAYNA